MTNRLDYCDNLDVLPLLDRQAGCKRARVEDRGKQGTLL